jgi:hypothetical protein
MKNAVIWDVKSCGSCKNRSFGGNSRFHHQGVKNWRDRKNVLGNYQKHTAPYRRIRHYSYVGLYNFQHMEISVT